MKKLDLKTPDLTAENVEKLAALFPNCATETRDAEGKVKRAIDFDLLRQELSADVVDGPQERYRLDWPGKREALALANAPIDKTLRPCRDESVDFETTQNLYIEGDNLDALKLLQETYLGKVKMIYIDPPYNTGNDFIYDDNFSISREDYQEKSGEVDEEGHAMFDEEKWKQNSSSNGRFHSEWLSMIYPRLKLARNLLTNDGCFLASIDEGEVGNLRKICDEVFGESNFVTEIVWHKRISPANDSRHFSSDHDIILVYAKDKESWRPERLQLNDEQKKNYANPDGDLRGAWNSSAYTCAKSAEERPNLYYPILQPNSKDEIWPSKSRVWAYEKSTHERHVKENRIYWGKAGLASKPRLKKFLTDAKPVVPRNVWLPSEVGSNAEANVELKDLFGDQLFSAPKPVRLIYRLAQLATDENAVVLDFFSGSATTAHAIIRLNADDDGHRRHIMVQLPEPCDDNSATAKSGYPTIAEIGKERIRRAGAKIRDEIVEKVVRFEKDARISVERLKDASQKELLPKHREALETIIQEAEEQAEALRVRLTNLDTGFRVLKIDSPSRAAVFQRPGDLKQDELGIHVDNLKPDRSDEDLLFQVMLDWGVDFGLPIREETLAGKKVFFVAENSLAACFAHGVDDALIRELAKREPVRVVFRDSGFASDAAKINAGQLFKALSPHTDLKTL